LETASFLHLYTEGFRTVEDIYNILQVAQARRKVNPQAPPIKAKLMAAYYEKLTSLFWVSENYLFHAFAWYKYYTLCKEFNRSISVEMKQKQASAVLLAALCIPTYAPAKQTPSQQQSQQQHGITSTIDDDIVKEKMSRMATLLGFHTRHPTREALLMEIRSNRVMDGVPDYLKELYLLLEESSDPLVLVDQAKPLLERLQKELGATHEIENGDLSDSTLGRYVKPLTSVLLLKLLWNLSAAYHTVSLDHLKRLTDGLGIPFDRVEKEIVLVTQSKSLVLRIDHREGCLRFGDPELESDLMRSQLIDLTKSLKHLVQTKIQPSDPQLKMEMRTAFYQEIRNNVVAEHEAVLARKNLIEERKEESERLAQEKIKQAELLRIAEDVARKEEEEKRIAREQRLREKEKLRKIQKEMEAMEKKKYLQAMGRNVEAMTEEEMDQIDTAMLAKEHAEKTNKKKDEIERKAREEAKRLDYLVRAVRIEELSLVKARYEEKIKADRERYESEVIEKAKKAKEEWEADVKEKAILQDHGVFNHLAAFQEIAMAGRKKLHKEQCKAEDARAELEAELGKLKRARKRKEDDIKRRAEEEKRRLAEEEAARLAEEKAQREEENRRKAAEEERKYLAETNRMREERERKEKEKNTPPPLESTAVKAVYVPPSLRNRDASSNSSSNRFADRGGGYGGGRYDGRQQQRQGFGSDRGVDRGVDRSRVGGDRVSERRGYDDRRRDDRGGNAGGGKRW
jgi:translation initiation factor 3 subunit A